MKYFYAYHGPKNTKDFDYSNGYGVGQEWKTRQVTPGDRLLLFKNSLESETSSCVAYSKLLILLWTQTTLIHIEFN